MTDLRTAAQQALEALENPWAVGPEGVANAITALRAALAQQITDAGFTRRPSLWALQARETLELIAAPQRPDGTWNRDREACRQLAAEALGRYDDE